VDSGPYEYAMLKIFQSYSLGDPYVRDDKKREFSNIQAELTWRFNPYLMVRWDAGFDPNGGGFDKLNTLVRVKDKRNDAFQIEYRYSKNPIAIGASDTGNKINTINFHTRVKTIDPLYLYGGIRYNFEDRSNVENIYGLEYQAQCWAFGFFFEDKRVGVTVDEKNGPLVLKRDTGFLIYVNLLGLGSLGSRPKFMGF